MAKFLIADYRIEWNLAKDKGSAWVKPDSKKTFTEIPMSSNSELLTIIALLDGPKPVFIDTKKRTIATVSQPGDIPIT